MHGIGTDLVDERIRGDGYSDPDRQEVSMSGYPLSQQWRGSQYHRVRRPR